MSLIITVVSQDLTTYLPLLVTAIKCTPLNTFICDCQTSSFEIIAFKLFCFDLEEQIMC